MPITRYIDTIVIHCSDSPNGRPTSAKDIDRWHLQRGFMRADYFRVKLRFNTNLTSIGYHYVIGITGNVETGRHLDEIGAHAHGRNAKSIGICLVGTDRFTPEQWSSLDSLIRQLTADLAKAVNPVKPDHLNIIGHYQVPDSHKVCPNFDVPKWLENNRMPENQHVLLLDP